MKMSVCETIRNRTVLRDCCVTVITGFVMLACAASAARAQSVANVLLVINDNSPASIEVGEYYAKVRQVPARNIAHIKTVQAESISRVEYEQTIESPLQAWLGKQLLQDQILYIVLTKGVPLRVDGTGGQGGTVASVDSELTLLYRKMTGTPFPVVGQLDNPYFLGDKPITAATRFTRESSDLYLVTRLDGYAFDEVKGLIDRGMRPSRDGRIVLDQKATVVDRGGDSWLAEAADRLRASGQDSRVLLESTKAVAGTSDAVLGYFSWGSNDPANQLRDMGLKFAPGAIGGMFVSTDGRTFREPPATWRPAVAGSTTGGQSLVGDLIREGITGVSGHVSEPFLNAIVRPQILFPAYLGGFNLAESFYLAMPFLSWQDVVIGDPLCAPFSSAPSTTMPAGTIDPETGLPALFSTRLLAVVKSSGLKLDAIKLNLKALSLQAQDKPEPEVRALFEQATALEPRLAAAHMQLATGAEARNDWDEALKRYRAVLAADASNVIALNNLAYLLADKRKELGEALPLAEKAYRLGSQLPFVADTLGWIYYLRGDYAAARPILERAATAEPPNTDVLVHAAAVSVALKDNVKAAAYLDKALKADPKAGDRDDVKALREKIKIP
jgi:uncharacterized protein (TIGR03790 family)